MSSSTKSTTTSTSSGTNGSNKPSAASSPLSAQAMLYMFLLALQFGLQPILTRRFTPPTICRSTVVMMQEATKFVMALLMLTGTGTFKKAIAGWSVSSWISIACLPAALYSVQNLAALVAYQNLDALTFNVLNQTKTLSAALCCYFVMGRKQSRVQVFSLFVLLTSALVIEKIITVGMILSPFGFGSNNDSSVTLEKDVSVDEKGETGRLNFERKHFTHGVAPVLLASFISGLAGALSQKNLQSASGCGASGGRNALLFSMELCAASAIFLTASLFASGDGERIRENGFFDGWTAATWIPIFTNAAGGLLVGLVTKYAGSVRKGFALIFGILLSGMIQAAADPERPVTQEEILGGALAAISLWMHMTHPYVKRDSIMGADKSVVSNGKTVQAKRTIRKTRKED